MHFRFTTRTRSSSVIPPFSVIVLHIGHFNLDKVYSRSFETSIKDQTRVTGKNVTKVT